MTSSLPRHRALAGCLIVLGSAAVLPATAGAHTVRRSGPRPVLHVHPPKRKVGHDTSGNWSGYSVDGSNASAVSGSWTQPIATCSPGETSWSSPWLGIDGDLSNTVEQIGTDSDCDSGTPTYYAWYEMYPKQPVTISMAIHPGDVMSARVTATSASSFTLTLTDTTTGATYTTTQASKKARRTSVEWIMEGPSGSGGLTDFGSMPFSAAAATINGTSQSLFSFGAAANPITMVTSSGITRSAPSPVSSSGGFTVTWQHA
ncbi:MAG TPA: G1 family glutamic endopeptidase [Solirubrobacteraceae bacterium]|nr:G1 family glutamic endopeptidase [Solirubrobacteraceae bacterium]